MAYFDKDLVGEDYFLDPYEIESDVIGKMGCSPDYEELYEDGWTAWYSADEKHVIYLCKSFYGDHYELCDTETDETLSRDDFMILCEDCFGDWCNMALNRMEKAGIANYL